MDMEAAVAQQGDLADVVARAGAIMAAASRTSRPAAAAAAAAEDHMSSAAAMVVVPTCYDEEEEEEEPRPPAILEAPAMFDPYLTRTAPRGGYWLPPPHHQLSAVQISQHASCYVPMATDADEAQPARRRRGHSV
nr:unnamed protein product [Digitaria exilis]